MWPVFVQPMGKEWFFIFLKGCKKNKKEDYARQTICGLQNLNSLALLLTSVNHGFTELRRDSQFILEGPDVRGNSKGSDKSCGVETCLPLLNP